MNCPIGIFGDTGVGKSRICNRFVSNCYEEDYMPTIFCSYIKPIVHQKNFYSLEINESASDEGFVTDYTDVIEKSLGFLCIFDLTQETSLHKISEFRYRILNQKNLTKVPMIIVGNKSDLTSERKVLSETGQMLADKCCVPYIEVSAKFGTNISKCFEMLLDEIHPKNNLIPVKRKGCLGCIQWLVT
ncbi:unnamed protein product [Blepharisma stoltei]|uniref:Uncharacterized protein n=1 Tax=Blepharisma stoltei TaxID=1481888 RepID=A0AAU9K629_9CILI|nr:unnamed protein product [Blepharisma stoltei]